MFSRDPLQFHMLGIVGTLIKVTQNTKFFGLTINDMLTLNNRIENLVKKVSKNLFSCTAKASACSNCRSCNLSTVLHINKTFAWLYLSVFPYALPKYLQAKLERVQRRALSCIFLRVHYSNGLHLAGLESIRTQQDSLLGSYFSNLF